MHADFTCFICIDSAPQAAWLPLNLFNRKITENLHNEKEKKMGESANLRAKQRSNNEPHRKKKGKVHPFWSSVLSWLCYSQTSMFASPIYRVSITYYLRWPGFGTMARIEYIQNLYKCITPLIASHLLVLRQW